MFRKIMVPVDLAHLDALEKSLKVAADLARHYGAELCYVGVTSSQPGTVARTPAEYAQRLQAFALTHAPEGCEAPQTRVYNSPDPIADMDDTLVRAVSDTGADLVVMATHLPRHLDAIMPANGSKVAAHTRASILLVRPDAAR